VTEWHSCARDSPTLRFRPRGSPCNRDALVAARSSLPDPQRGSSRTHKGHRRSRESLFCIPSPVISVRPVPVPVPFRALFQRAMAEQTAGNGREMHVAGKPLTQDRAERPGKATRARSGTGNRNRNGNKEQERNRQRRALVTPRRAGLVARYSGASQTRFSAGSQLVWHRTR
jgi:hypothetical protein